VATRRGIASAGARALGGVITIGALAAVVATALFAPLASSTVSAPAATIAPVPLPQSRLCPGPLLQLSNGAGLDATTASAVGSASVVSGAGDPTATVVSTPVEAPDNATAAAKTVPVILTTPDAAPGVLLGGSQSQTVSADDLSGLAAASCDEPSTDSWVVGGATTVGRTSFLLLSNPTDVSADVSLVIYSEAGLVDAPGATGITVPAESQRILPLSGLVPDATSPVVHVSSTGGSVVATIQQSIVRGLEPGGVELTGPTTALATSQTMTGVQILGTSALAEKVSTDGYADLQAAVRVFVPGTADAQLSVTVTDEKAGSQPVVYTLTAPAGTVSEQPLRDLPDGQYSVTVQSSVPIVTAARTSVIANGALDFAWYQAEDELSSPFVLPVAPGPSPRIHLYNSGSSDAKITLAPKTGKSIEVTVPAGRSAGADLVAGTLYTVTPSAPVRASVGYSGNGLLSAYSVPSPSPLASPIVVYP
jgi:hypothetical protein